MPNAQCSMPTAQGPMLNAQCPMLNGQRRTWSQFRKASRIYIAASHGRYYVPMPKLTSFRVVVILLGIMVPAQAIAATCEQLTTLSVRGGRVTQAQTVAAGAFTPPAGRAGAPPGANAFATLGAFCRVTLTLKPGAQSDIKAE